MEGYYLFISAACLLLCTNAASGWEDMCNDIRKTFSQSVVGLSHQAYPDYTDRKHCQCNVTTDYSADILLKLQLHREAFEPQDNSGCSPRLMVAVVDREMQESSSALKDPQVQEMGGILRPSVGVCPMPHVGPFTATRSYVTMRSSQQLSVTFQNPSAHSTRFYVNLSVSPAQQVKVTCGSLVIPPPLLVESEVLAPISKKGSEIGAIVACVIIAAFIIAIFIIAYCRVKLRDRNRSQSGTPSSNPKRRSINDGKNTPEKGRGNPGYDGTPRSSVGDVSKNKPNDLNGRWRHQPGTDGVDNDLIPHDFLRRIAHPGSAGSSPRHVNGYHHEPASYPVRSTPNILPPASAIIQPGFPHQPIMDPIFAETPERYPGSNGPRGSHVSFPDTDQDSFDSPYTKPIPGSPSINAPSDSGYNGSDFHYPSRPNNEDTMSEISGLDDRPLTQSPDSGRPISQRSGTPADRTYTPDQLQKYPVRTMTPDGTKKLPRPYSDQPNEYANLGYDPDEAEPFPSKTQPKIPFKEYPDNASPLPIKEYPQAPNIIPMKDYPNQSAPLPVKEYPTEPVNSQPWKGVSPAPLPNYIHLDAPTKQAPKKKKKGPKNVTPQEPVKHQSPQVLFKPQSPESVQEEPIAPVHNTPPVKRDFTPEPIKQFRPISPDPNSPCTSPASMISGTRTPMGRSPYPQSPLIPPLGIDDGPYIPPSPWRMPYIYNQPLMYIDDTDSESVVSSMSTRDLYVRSHKEIMNPDGSVTPVMRDPYRPSYQMPPAQHRPETISETDV